MNKSRSVGLLYVAIVAGVIAVAGCSGGGGGSATAPAPISPGVTPTPTPGPTSSGVMQTATAILTFPHGPVAPNGPNYVSPNSTNFYVSIKALNGQPPPAWVKPTATSAPLTFKGANPNCSVSNGIATCSVTIPAPPGNVDYIMSTNLPPPSPAPTSTGVVLDYDEEGIQIKQGINNNVSITLEGVVQRATLSLASPLVPNASSTTTMTLTAYDASGAQITGTKPFNSPFKFTDADQFSSKGSPEFPFSTFLTVNGLPNGGGKQVQVNSPADVVQIVYGGVAMSNFKIEATGNGRDGAFSSESPIAINLYPIVLPGTFVDNSANGGKPTDPNYDQNTLALQAGGPVYSITPSELGRTDFPYSDCSPNKTLTCIAIQDLTNIAPSCGALVNHNPNDIAPFDPGPPNGQTNGYMYTITPQNRGLCLEQFVDGLGGTHAPPPSGNPLVNGEIWVQVK